VNAKAFGLVEGQDVFVFEEDFQAHRFRAEFRRRGFLRQDLDAVTDSHGALGRGGGTVDEDAAVLDEGLEFGPRKLGESNGEIAIEPLARTLALFHLQGNHVVV
jgi:hypothetical protein